MNRDDADSWLIVEKAKREVIQMVEERADFYRYINLDYLADALMAQIGDVKMTLSQLMPLVERIKNGSEPIED